MKEDIKGASSVSFRTDGTLFMIDVFFILDGQMRKIVKVVEIERAKDDEKLLTGFIAYCNKKIATTTILDKDCYILV
jgi:hypothetical protein